MNAQESARRLARILIAALVLWVGGVAQSVADDRVALVIGNSLYTDEHISGSNNADAMVDVLTGLNFRVTELKDGTLQQINDALADFSMRTAGASMVAVFYSGHGFHLGAENFLLPIGGGTTAESSIALSTVVAAVEKAPSAATKLIMLDACRNISSLGTDQGFAEPTTQSDKLLFMAFAASVGQTAVVGNEFTRSPYSLSLERHLREPGVTVRDILSEVSREVHLTSSQLPTSFGDGRFYLRSPVRARAVIDKADGDLLLLLNGDIRYDLGTQSRNPVDLVLHAGDNPLMVAVASQRTYHNTQSWEKTEGWGYCMRLFGPGGTELKVACGGRSPCFSASEDAPFKDGSHHGKVFTVARAVLNVDPITAALTLASPEPDVWKNALPLAEQNQGVLYEVSAAEVLAKVLNVTPDVLTTTLAQVPGVVKVLFPNLPPLTLPDLSHMVARIRGNTDFTPSAVACMKDHEADRLNELRAGIASALNGSSPLPLQGFDNGLSACIQAGEAQRRGVTQGVKIWSDFEDTLEPNDPFSCPVL